MRVSLSALSALFCCAASILNAADFSIAPLHSDTPSCERFGTQVEFQPLDRVFEMAERASKPVVLLHLSGNFSKSAFT